MNNFYKQYPAVDIAIGEKLAILFAKYSSPLPFGFIIWKQSSINKDAFEIIDILGLEIPFIYLMGAALVLISLISYFFVAPYIENIFKKNAYIRKYGKSTEAVWKMKKGALGIVTGGILNIEGVEVIYNYGKNKERDSLLRALNDGDKIKVIYNPEDPRDFVLDLKTNV